MVDNKVISNSLDEFARKNKIDESQYRELKGRKNTIIDFIERYSNEVHDLKISNRFNVGSYKIRTGVQRDGENGWAFDIDYVMVYSREFDYESFKGNLTNWLRTKVKEHYKRNVIVSNKKKVVSIAFRNHDNTKTEFYLDVALYIKDDNGDIHHVKRDESGEYSTEMGKPRDTYERQKKALANNPSKRNAIVLLKYLKEKNRIKGASSISITDKIILFGDDLDSFSLIRKFVKDNLNTFSFKLEEEPKSELIENSSDFRESLKEMDKKFYSSDSTIEVFAAMNSWFDYKFPELDKELMKDRNERYSGG